MPPPAAPGAGRGRSSAAFRGAVRLRVRRLPGPAPAGRWRAGTGCWWPRRPGRARRWSASSPCTWRWPQGRKCFYTTPIKALSNQKYADLVRRYGAGQRRPAHRRQQHQRRGAGGGDDHRGAAQHALRRVAHAGRARLRGPGRGALPGRPVPRRGVGRGHHPPARVGPAGGAVGDGQQRRGVRRLAGRGPRRHHGDRGRAPAGPAVAAHAGRGPAVRPVHRSDQDGPAGPRARGPRAPWSTRSCSGSPGGTWARAGAGPGAGQRPRAAGARRPAAASRSAAAEPAGGDRPAGRGRAAARDHVHLQPGRLRRRRAAVPGRRAAADHAGGGRGDHRAWPSGAPPDIPRARTCRCSATASGCAGLQRGIAAHHAGLLPTFKEVVEELFAAGLVRAVFATETLALGINMPARTVVIERLDKWNGEAHADLTPGEYTQLTGRAGRRGIDVEGHAVVLWQPGIDPAAVAGLAGTRTYPLQLQLPAVLQHGREPGRPGRPGPGRGAAGIVVRPVPGRPGGGRPGPAGPPQPGRAGRAAAVRCDARRLRRVPARCAGSCPSGRGTGPGSASAARRARGGQLAGPAAPRRHHPGARRPPGGRRGGPRPVRRRRRGRAAAAGAHRRPPGQASCRWPTSRSRSPRSTGSASRPFSARSAQHRRDLAATVRTSWSRPGTARAARAAGRAAARPG